MFIYLLLFGENTCSMVLCTSDYITPGGHGFLCPHVSDAEIYQ